MNRKILILFAFCIHFILNGQSIDSLTSALPLPFENVNLFTDRDLYLSGETIWFSASVSLDNDQETLSKIIYIELFNTNQRSIIRKKYRINQGFAEGALDIPSEFLSDVYYLRAYTPYNKNFPVERYFVSALQIINPRRGIPAKMEAKNLDKTILSSEDLLYSIKTIQPREEMQLVSIYRLQKGQETNEQDLNVELLDNHQQLISRAEFTLNSYPTLLAFPDSSFSKPGLYYYLLKDQEGKILQIHAFVFNNSTQPIANNEFLVSEFKQRIPANINLSKSVPHNYSQLGIKIAQKGSILSPTNKLKLYMRDPYLLISFLKTQFNPLNLNLSEADTTLKALNKKLNIKEYKDLFYTPNIFKLNWNPGLKNIGLNGVAVEKKSQKPLSNIPIYLSIFDHDRPQIYIVRTRADGSFNFSITNYEYNKDALLCPLFEKTNDIELKIDPEFTTDFPQFKEIPLTIDSSSIDLLEEMLIASHFAKSFKIKSKQQDFNVYDLPFSFDDPEVSINLNNYIATPTLEMVFKELITSVRIRKRKNSYTLSIIDIEADLQYKNPLILVDDVPVFNLDELLKISPEVIEKIEVHYTPFYMKYYIVNGIVMISTHTDNLGGMTIPKASTFFNYQTFSPAYTFKAKTYRSEEETNSRSGDFRTLLHWNPLIQANDNQQLNFYTSDQTGEYEAYIFGTYENGQGFHFKVFDFKVTD